MPGPRRVIDRRAVFSSPWCELVAKSVDFDPHPYYSLVQRDYVAVLAVDDAQRILVVEQFRPPSRR